jgi:putative flippase GtrA
MKRLAQASTGARYLAVVGTAAVLDLGGFLLLTRVGTPVPPAAALAFLAAAAFNYSASARWVFRQPPTARRFLLFLATGLVGLLVNTGVTASAHAAGLAPGLAKLAGIGVAFFVNAALNVTVVFAGARRPAPPPAA